MPLKILAALVAFWLWTGAAIAQNCTATMTDLDFGTVTLRSGAQNHTSGVLELRCAGLTFNNRVGVCIRFGAGSGGAQAGLSPRYLRRSDASALAFELRRGGAGHGNPTWTAVYVEAPTSVFGTRSTMPVYAAIAQSGVSAATGPHSSTFSGPGQAEIETGVDSCTDTGTISAISDFEVRALVADSCEVEATSLDFGTISALRRETAVGALVVRCTQQTGFTVRLDNGSGAGASGPTDRRMTGPNGQIRYGIYRDSGHGQPWGETAATWVGGAGTGGDQTYGLYGLIPPGQALRAGDYSDSVLVTVEY